MAEQILPNYLGIAQNAYAFGQQQGAQKRGMEQRSRLASLAQQAYGAAPDQRDAIMQQAVGVDPEAGLALSKGLRGEEDAREQALLNTARMIDGAPPEMKDAIFQQARPRIAQYLPNLPPAYDDQVGQGIKAFIASRANTNATPAGFQELHMKALAAGLKPGSPEYQEAMNISLGRQGRAATGGFGFEKVIGADGRERMGRTNPRTGVFEVYDEGSGNFVPMGGPAALNGGPMGGSGAPEIGRADMERDIGLANEMIAAGIPETQVDAFLRSRGERASGIQPQSANPALGVSQSPAERKFAEESGQQAAQLATLGRRGEIEAQNEALKTGAREAAEAQAQKAAALPQTIASADETIALLDRVLNHRGREAATGVSAMNPLNKIPGTDAYDFNVMLDQIKGQSFLQAFQSLKGGGAITEREGQAATNAIARLNAAQSEGEFVNAINDLKRIVQQGRDRAIQGAAAPRPAQAPQQGRAALPPGFSWED